MLTDKVAPVTRILALDERAARQGISVDRARADLLGEAQIRGIALPLDGAWTAQ